MQTQASQCGWSWIASGLDVELQYSVPVRITRTRPALDSDELRISKRVYELTGLTISY